jgi:hypothetical protein
LNFHGGETVATRIWSNVAVLFAIIFAHDARAQVSRLELTPAGKAVLHNQLAVDGSSKPEIPPLPTCMFPSGLCGAVHRDGSVAVPPRYDWVGQFVESRAAVRVGGLYGFVDETGREIVTPQYRIVDDYKHGFAQVDVDGKSGLIDRDGKMVMEPKYGFIEAIGPDRFRVSERRRLGGLMGGEDFSGVQVKYTPSGLSISDPALTSGVQATEVIDSSGQRIEPLIARRVFNKEDPTIRWVEKDRLWGLARADGSWLVEPKFQQVDSLIDGLARVTMNGKVGFIDRTGNFSIEPVFDKAWSFKAGFGRTSAQQDGAFGVIDRTGAWVFRTDYQQVRVAISLGEDRKSETVFGWHFEKDDRWGLLDLDGRVVLGADFDQTIQRCADGRLVAYKNKEWLYFKNDGAPLQPQDGRLIDAPCGSVPPYTLKIGDKFGLVDAESRPVTPVHFDAIVWAGRDAKNVKLDGKWGRIGLDGGWMLEPKFDYLSTGGDIFVASIDGKRGFMRSDGTRSGTTWLIEPKFDAARRRDADTAFVTVAGATGVLRLTDQSWVVAPRPGVMCGIGSAIMSESGGKRVILSPTGDTWIDIGAERIGVALDLGLLTFLKNDKWGLVDTAGQVIMEPQFEQPVYFRPGLRGVAWAKREASWCAIDRRGNRVPGIACTDADPLGGPNGRFECKVES